MSINTEIKERKRAIERLREEQRQLEAEQHAGTRTELGRLEAEIAGIGRQQAELNDRKAELVRKARALRRRLPR